MNSGPYNPPPSDAPPPGEPQGVPTEPQPTPEAPSPGYYAPPAPAGYAPPPRQRNMGPLIAGIVIVVVLIAAIGGYVVGGVVYAQTRVSSARDAYNKAVQHENSLTDTVNSAQDQIKNLSFSGNSTTSSLQTFKTTWAGIVTKSEAVQPQIDADDSSLAKADASLHENSWLTVLAHSDLDKYSTKIGHERSALKAAKTLTTDYVQIGAFYQAFADVGIDFETLAAKAQATDISGAAAASDKLKTDTNKAIGLDKAPGLPADIDTLLHDMQSMSTDFTNLINAAAQNNDTAFNNAEKALQADAAKVEAFDSAKADTAITQYYQALVDAYNSEVDKANAG